MIVSVSFTPAPSAVLRCCSQSTQGAHPSVSRADVADQVSWPPPFRFLAATVQDPMTADRKGLPSKGGWEGNITRGHSSGGVRLGTSVGDPCAGPGPPYSILDRVPFRTDRARQRNTGGQR